MVNIEDFAFPRLFVGYTDGILICVLLFFCLAASLSEEARARARKAGDEMGMKDEEGAYAEGVANEPAEHQEEEQEEMEEMAPARITRAPPPPPNMSTRPPPPEVMRRVSQGSKRASLPPPPRGALSVLEPEADREYGAPPTRRIPPPPMHDDGELGIYYPVTWLLAKLIVS